MFDDDELEEIQEEQSWIELTREKTEEFGQNPRFRFGASFASAAVLLVFVLMVILSIGYAPAVSVGEVGGFQVDIDRIVGRDVAFYPGIAETAACQNTSADATPESGDAALPLVEAEVGQARVPATSQLRIRKDFNVPGWMPNLHVVRITLGRYFTPTNPRYPPTADTGLYAPSDGYTERGSQFTWLNELSFDGIEQVAPSQDNQGYRDFTRLRSNNQTPGTGTGKAVNVTTFTNINYGEASASDYARVGGQNPDRYIDRVQFAGDSGGFSGNDSGGYLDNTDVVFGNVSRDTSPSIEVDAHGGPPLFQDARASSFPLSNGIVADNLAGDNDYDIYDVEYAGISNFADSGTGYSDFTNIHTATLPKGNSTTLTARGDRYDPTYTDVSNTRLGSTAVGDPAAGCSSKCGDENDHHIYQVYWDGNSYGTPQDCVVGDPDADGYQDYTSYRTGIKLVPNQTYTLRVQIDASDDTSGDATVVWIDWDDDGNADGATPGGRTIQERYEISDGSGYGTDGNCPDYSWYANIKVPANLYNNMSLTDTSQDAFFDNGSEPGSVAMRIVSDGGGTFWTNPDGPSDGFHGEMEDYTVPIEEPQSNFRAWVDWDQDDDLSDADETFDLPDGFTGTSTPDSSGTIDVPTDAVGGSTLLRVTHKSGYPSLQTVEPTPNEGVGGWIGHTEDYTVEVQSDGEAHIKAWIDWNQDGDFKDNDEVADLGQASSPTTDGDFTLGPTGFYVPNKSFAGTTMLRVGLGFGKDPPPDSTGVSGEYEDYTVHVEAVDNTTAVAWIDWDQSNTLDHDERFFVGNVTPSQYLADNTVKVKEPVDIPNSAPTGVTLMRVTESMGSTGKLNYVWYKSPTEGYGIAQSSAELSTYFGDPGSTSNVTYRGGVGVWTKNVSWNGGGFTSWFEHTKPAGLPENNFSWKAVGSIYAPTSGTYTFGTDGDDGNDVVINGTPLSFSTYTGNTVYENNTTVTLDQGWHGFQARMQERNGGENFKVGWQKPSDSQIHEIQPKYFATWPGSRAGADDTFFGESEDYTVVVGPQTEGPDYAENVTLGDATFRFSDLKADEIAVRTSVIDEDYADGSSSDPIYTSDGEFKISGEIVDITNLDARAHYVAFDRMNMRYVNLTVNYNPPNPQNETSLNCLGFA